MRFIREEKLTAQWAVIRSLFRAHELFDVLSQAGTGRHAKPVGLLDVRGYYRNLIAFLDHAVSERFVAADARSRLVADDEPVRLLDRLVALAA